MNKMTPYIVVLLFVLVGTIPHFATAQSDKNLVRQGNREFKNGQFNEAEINYRKALDKNPTNSNAQFNLGDAMYEQENYEKAAEVFSKTDIKTKTSEEKSDVYYNLGNSMLKAGKGNEAIAAYKQALRENPANEQARYNLEYARQKSKDQQQDQDKNKDDQDKQDENKDKQDQDQQDQNKDDQEQKDQDKEKQEQNQDQQDQQQNQQNQNDPQQGEQNEQQAQKISKKDAERMLEALKNNEKKTLEKLKKAKKENARVIKSEKDW